jgi:hypothetical protein
MVDPVGGTALVPCRCTDCATRLTIRQEVDTPLPAVVLCDPCLAARVTRVAESRAATPRRAPPARSPAQQRLLALYAQHPSWTAQQLATALTAEGYVRPHGAPWHRQGVVEFLTAAQVWQPRRRAC